MINDAQVIIGETTTSSKSPIDAIQPASRGGRAILSVVSLVEIALERCDSARCAVETMGALSDEFGFFQDAGTPTGEALVVGDTREVWLFHILPPLSASDATGGRGAIWAAARVPDGHVAAVPNVFVIRDVALDRPSHFLYGASLLSAARTLGWTDGTPLDFTATFADGEYGGRYYSGRRIWRALSMLADPDELQRLQLPTTYDEIGRDAPYPPWIRAAPRSISIRRVFDVHRDYYSGTPYDLTAGLAAGPSATPNRFMFPASPFNTWERPISIYRTTSSYVAQARAHVPGAAGTVWFGPHVAHGTVYVPLAVGMPRVPRAYAGSGFEAKTFDRRGAYWAHVALQAMAEGRFEWVQHELASLQEVLETAGLAAQAATDALLLGRRRLTQGADEPNSDDSNDAEAAPYAPLHTHAATVVQACWQLWEGITFRYADGFVRAGSAVVDGQPPVGMGYPAAWLRAVGYNHSILATPMVPVVKPLSAPQLRPSEVAPLAKTPGWLDGGGAGAAGAAGVVSNAAAEAPAPMSLVTTTGRRASRPSEGGGDAPSSPLQVALVAGCAGLLVGVVAGRLLGGRAVGSGGCRRAVRRDVESRVEEVEAQYVAMP